jgi:hypothetical protein
MSEIPFVDALGDEIERRAAARIAARRGRIRRRIVIGGLSFAIAATGVAAASGVFGTPEELATTSVACYESADLSANVSVVSVADGTPVEACRRELGSDEPLVACAAGPQLVVLPGRTCDGRGLGPVPEEYDAARAKVVAFHRAVVAIEESSDCMAPAALAGRVQRLLDDAGWTGWGTTIRDDLGDGPCGTVTTLGGDGRRYLEGSLDARDKLVLILPEAPRSLMDLLFGPHGIVGSTMDASGERCFTVEGVRDLARRRLAQTDRPVTFSVGSRPAETEIAGERGERLDEGCAVIVGVGPTADDRILVEIWR